MKLRTFVHTFLALSSATAIAAAASPVAPTPDLRATAAGMESRYPGKVVAIEFDDSGDKAAHYHVDMLFHSGLTRLDVDAATHKATLREPESLGAGSVTLAEAAARLAKVIPGEMLAAQLDATSDVAAHYDVDILLPQGAVARLKVDAATGQIGWRTPAVIAD